jgi:hypothetical protein
LASNLFFYFDFHPHSFNYYFFYFRSFYVIDFPSILSFNVWFGGDWASQFFYVWCFRYNDPGHGFEKLMQVNIFFCFIFFFDFIVQRYFFKNDFVVFFNSFSIKFSWSNDLDHEFYELTQVTCLSQYFKFTWARFFCLFIIQSMLPNVFFSHDFFLYKYFVHLLSLSFF